jgi:hypothetical protein
MTNVNKYGFIVSVDQFGRRVPSDYLDTAECDIMDEFARCIRHLITSNKAMYTMIELGSNQAFYSLMFKHLIGKDKTINILVEPHPPHFIRSQEQFALNQCEGVYYNRGVGQTWVLANGSFSAPPITIGEIFQEQLLNSVDIVHCDIDGAEDLFLTENEEMFTTQRIGCLFVMTHGYVLHAKCIEFFLKIGYEKTYEFPFHHKSNVDGCLVFTIPQLNYPLGPRANSA